MQMGFYFDQARCTGCYACVVACKDWNNVPAGPASWLRLKTIEKGEYPEPFVAFLTMPCYHCEKPACVSACPAGAISKREQDGIVVVARDSCLGKNNCDKCLRACPYATPQFGAEENARMQKCDLCLARLVEGKNPICVDACPARALDAGPMEKLEAKYGVIREAEGFVYSEERIPSIVFTPKKDRKGRTVKKTTVSPQTMLSR